MYWFLFPEEWITLLCDYLDCYTLAPFRATYKIADEKAQTVHEFYFNTHRDALESANRLLGEYFTAIHEQLGEFVHHGGIYHRWQTLAQQNVSLEQIHHTTGYAVSNRRREQQRALAGELQFGSDDDDNPWSGLR